MHLENCLNSIIKCKLYSNLDFEVCISDNDSSDQTRAIVEKAQLKLPIKYHKNETNVGIPKNFLNVISMAKGDFIWLLGDDDLLLPDAISRLYDLLEKHPDVDFFYVNSFHLSTEYLETFSHPFDTDNLPTNMQPFSNWDFEGELPFLELVNPRVSFDFLGGMFLSVFRRKLWISKSNVLTQSAINDPRTFSHFDNTFPHIKIFAHAFSNRKAYFNKEPLNVCLTGAREWSHMSPLIMSIRLVESLEIYRKFSLGFLQYMYCRNYALRNFIPDFVNMLIQRKTSGIAYINPLKIIISNLYFPNFYLSLFYFFGRRLFKIFKK